MTGDDAINKPADSARGTDTANRPQPRVGNPAPGPAGTSGPGAGTQPAPRSGGTAFGGVAQQGSTAEGRSTSGAAIRGEAVGSRLTSVLVAQSQGAANSNPGNGNGPSASASAGPQGRPSSTGPGTAQAGAPTGANAQENGRATALRQQGQAFQWGFASGPDVPVETVGNFLPLVGTTGTENAFSESPADRFVRSNAPRFFATGGLIRAAGLGDDGEANAQAAASRNPGQAAEQGDVAETAFKTDAQKAVEAAVEGEDSGQGDNAGEGDSAEDGANSTNGEAALAEATGGGDGDAETVGESAPIGASQEQIDERLRAIFGEAVSRYADTASLLTQAAPSAGVELVS